ncbi:MAG: hypothetical protein QF464_10555, partial [Myxococcota bacterium]|nr:hypothetical protein [Myxococcota bacterium]
MRRWRGLLGWVVVAVAAGGCGDDAPVAYEGDEAGECSDGADNDQDEAFDCFDPGCAGAPVCQGDSSMDAGGEEDVASTPDASPVDAADAPSVVDAL